MAKLNYKNGLTSIILRVKLLDSTSTTGAGLTGLTFSSTGLRISTIADNEATATAYTVAGSTIETITTLGTFAAPTATKCRFKEVDSTNHIGLYEIQIADARWAVSNARSVIVSISGATNQAQCDLEVQLEGVPANGNDIADSILKRDWTSVTGEASRSMLNALRFLRNKWATSGTSLSVKKEDDTTEAWAGTVTVDTNNNINSMDPS